MESRVRLKFQEKFIEALKSIRRPGETSLFLLFVNKDPMVGSLANNESFAKSS